MAEADITMVAQHLDYAKLTAEPSLASSVKERGW